MAAFKMDSLPLFVPQFLAEVSELDNASVGVYIKLLCYQWEKGDLPTDAGSLARLSGETKTKFAKIWEKIEEKFCKKNEKRIHNIKLEEVRKDKIEFKAKLSKSGSDGAAKRWGSHRFANDIPNDIAIDNPNAYYNSNNNTPKGVYISEEKENTGSEFEIKEEKKKVAAKKKSKRSFVDENGNVKYPEREGTCYTFNDFYNDYDKKIDKDDVYDLFEKTTESERAIIKDHVQEYKRAQPDKQYRTNPTGYLRKKKWNNEIISRQLFQPPAAPIPPPNTSPQKLEDIYNFNPMQNGNV